MLMVTPAGLRLMRGAAATNPQRRAAVRLAGNFPPVRRKLNRDRYEALLDKVVTILRARSFSKFEYEGPIRAGLRSSLCLDGWRWPEADACAAELVLKGLDRIGAVRPSWAEGQASFTYDGLHDITRCQNCHATLDADRYEAGARFCSASCKAAAKVKRQTIAGEKMTRVEYLAACAVNRERNIRESVLLCETCNTPFIAHDREHRFCSHGCYSVSLRTVERRDCAHCGKAFKPESRTDRKRFCSKRCSGDANVKPREDRFCTVCGSPFRVTYPSEKKRTCSKACAGLVRHQTRRAMRCDEVTT